MLHRNALPNRTTAEACCRTPLSNRSFLYQALFTVPPCLQGGDEVVELVSRQACCQGSSIQFDPQEGESRGRSFHSVRCCGGTGMAESCGLGPQFFDEELM